MCRPYWLHIAAYGALGLAATPLVLLTPLPLKIAVDSVLGDRPLPWFLGFLEPWFASRDSLVPIAVTALLLVGIALLRQLHRAASALLYTYTGEKIVFDVRSRLFRHVQGLSLRYHDGTTSADSVYRVLWDAPSIRHLALDGFLPFLTAGVTLVSVLWVITKLDAQLALVAMAAAPALLLLIRFYRGRLRGRWRDVKRKEASALSVVQEVLDAIRVVKSFSQEEREQERFERRSDAGVRARLRAFLASDSYEILIAMTTAAGTAAVLFLGVWHVRTDVLTLGELLVVMAYLGELYGPLNSIAKNLGKLQSHVASAERVFGLFDNDARLPERPDARPLQRAAGAFELRGVTFSYDGRNAALHDLSLSIPAGRRVALVGPSGAGKSTLVSLLARFYDPGRGQVLLDGVDVRDLRLRDLRAQFSIMLQEPILFVGTIADNIAYSRPGAPFEDVLRAAGAAGAHEFISRLPEGYLTEVGERGVRLSGGERQRIALARAFLRDASILILDEPTSSVDGETESGIIEAMERLMVGRTTFVIAHRPSTLARCDLAVELAGGRLRRVGDVVPGTRLRGIVGGKGQAARRDGAGP